MTLLRKNSSRNSVGLDIDGGFLAAVEAGGGQIRRAVSADLEPGLVADGEVTDAERLSASLRDFFKDNELPRNVKLGVANQQIAVRQIELPQIEDKREREQAIQFQAAEAIAMPLDEAIVDHQVVGVTSPEDGAPRMRVVVVAARTPFVEGLVEAVRAAGLKPEGVDLEAFALVRTLAPATEGDETARVYCHLAGLTNLAIAVGDTCLFTRPLASGWDGEPHLAASALADEVRLSIDYYMAQPGATPVTEAVLSGPGSTRQELCEAFGTQLDVPVTRAEPLGKLDTADLQVADDPHRYTVAAGLAIAEAA